MTPHASIALFTDLYQFTMLQSYLEEGMLGEAVFSLFVRRLPERRNYLLACGTEDVLQDLEDLRFDSAALEYLAATGKFTDRTLQYLEQFRFRGEVRIVPDGVPVFANEPLLEVTASLPEAQVVETLVMNRVHLQTLLASKAVRVVTAAQGRPIVDFGLRRIHGLDAALYAARAFYVAGVEATSNVAAGQVYGIPIAGTMAHSYVQAHDDELEAFRHFARRYPGTTLLVDTYDTLAAVHSITKLAQRLGDEFQIHAIRLDSGDLESLARAARDILDRAGLATVRIVASGNLDEDAIDGLLTNGAPIDVFGVGTKMGVSDDVPSLDVAYKLVAYEGRGRFKLAPGKKTLPGRKQVFRIEENGVAARDILAQDGEDLPGRPLLAVAMTAGKRVRSPVPLQTARLRAKEEIMRLPDRVRGLAPANPPYSVDLSPTLAAFCEELGRSRL